MNNDLSKLPPPPKGQAGISPDQFAHLPPPPKGQQGMTLAQIQSQQPAQPQSLGLLSKIGSSISGAFKSGVGQIRQGATEIGKGENPLQAVGSALKIGGGIVGAATSPIAPILNPTVGAATNAISNKIGDIPAVQKFAMTPTGKTTAQVAEGLTNAGAVSGGILGVGGGEAVAPKVSGLAKSGLDTIKSEIGEIKTARATSAEAKALENSIKNTMPHQDKSVRIDQLRGAMPEGQPGTGGVVRSGKLGTSEAVPTAKDIEVGTTAHPLIGKTKDPLMRIQNVNKGISNASKVTDEFLNSNPSKVNFEDVRGYVESNKPTSNLQKDPGAFETYNRVNENAIDTLYDTLKSSAKGSGNFGSEGAIGADIRQARMKIDQQITRELGETTFGSPQYKGIRAAEVDVRNTINRLNEDILRYPNQLEKVNRMNDFISTARGRGIEINLNDPAVQTKLEQQFGLEKAPASEANAQKLANAHKTMENLFTARDNMIDRYQSNLGKNKIKEWIKANPGKAKAIGWGVGLVGADTVYNLLK